ncbi:unnamed protein product, partial [Sphagnum balticum]
EETTVQSPLHPKPSSPAVPSPAGFRPAFLRRNTKREKMRRRPPAQQVYVTINASETQKTVLTGAKRTKAQGYAELAAYVNAKTGSNWTQSDAMSRFRSLETTYKNTKRRYANVNGEKYTLTSEDLAKGIKTIDDKLEN